MAGLLRAAGLQQAGAAGGVAGGVGSGVNAHFVSARGAVKGEPEWVESLDGLVGEIRQCLDGAVRERAAELARLVQRLEAPGAGGLGAVKRKLAFWRGLRTSESQAQRLIGCLLVDSVLFGRFVDAFLTRFRPFLTL